MWSFDDGNLFTLGSTAKDACISPALGGSGELRLAIDCGIDWWKTEFMVFGTKVEYRGAGGDQDRVAGNAGQKLYLNFGNDTGEIK